MLFFENNFTSLGPDGVVEAGLIPTLVKKLPDEEDEIKV